MAVLVWPPQCGLLSPRLHAPPRGEGEGEGGDGGEGREGREGGGDEAERGEGGEVSEQQPRTSFRGQKPRKRATRRGIRNHHIPFMMRFAFLWLFATAGRGQDSRCLALADLFSYASPFLKPHTAAATVFASINDSGKHIYGKKEFMGALRHMDVEMCPVGAEAAYMFLRFEMENETIPDFSAKHK